MFQLTTNLVTDLLFPHSQMHNLSKKDHILKLLRNKLEGRYFLQHGIIVQIPDLPADEPDSLLPLPLI